MALTPATGLADYASGISTAALQVNSDTGQVSIGTDSPTTARLRVGTAITMSVGVITATDAVFRGNVSIAGTLTYEDVTSIDSVGLVTARTGVRVTENGLIVAGISTFSSALDVNAELDVDGQTDLDNLIVTGVSTFSSAIDLNADLDVDGHTDLDNLVVSGVSTFAADVSIADKIIHTGDTNTAIRFPDADTFTVETGGSERVRVTSAGRLGINTSSPSGLLQVGDSSGSHIIITPNTGVDINDGAINLYQATDNASAAPLIISTDIGGTETEQFRVTAGGKVGIGTSNPQRDLHIHNSDSTTNSYLQITSATTGTASGDGFQLWAYGSGSSQNAAIVQRENADIEIWTNNTEKLRIDSAGKIGIGLTDPGTKVEVSGGQNQTANEFTDLLRIAANANNDSLDAEVQLNFGIMPSHTATGNRRARIQSITHAGSARALVLNPDGGNIGIGTNNPEEILHILGPSEAVSNRDGVMLQHTTATAAADTGLPIVWSGHIGNNDNYGLAAVCGRKANGDSENAAGYLQFATTNSVGALSEKMRVHPDGTISIGRTVSSDPNRYLQIHNANAASSAYFQSTNTGTGSTAADGVVIGMGDATNTYIWNYENGAIIFATNGGQAGMFDSSRNLLVGKSGSNFATQGTEIRDHGEVVITRTAGEALVLRRNTSNGQLASFRNTAGTTVGTIVTSSSTTTYNTSSDYRLKENVVDLTDAIPRLKNLPVHRFNFITDADLTVDGFLAHEAQLVVPESVTGEKDGEEMQYIDQSKLVPLLTAALQEAIAEIENLKERVKNLES